MSPLKRYDTIIAADQLAADIRRGAQPTIVDCRFELSDPLGGWRAYQAAHIPSAHYLDLDRDLCGKQTGRNGRHPLPSRSEFARTISALGVNAESQLIFYDAGESTFAARAWWMMKWLGHDDAAVLDGGFAAWAALGEAVTADLPMLPQHGNIAPGLPLVSIVGFEEVRRASDEGSRVIVDARAPERYRGEIEPIDTRAGHIPQAANRYYQNNLEPDGTFKSSVELRNEFIQVLAGAAPSNMIAQCGSGITACNNLLAMAIGGLNGAALYPGSWSEWCTRAMPGDFAKDNHPISQAED